MTKAQTLGSLHCVWKTQIHRILRTLPGEFTSPQGVVQEHVTWQVAFLISKVIESDAWGPENFLGNQFLFSSQNPHSCSGEFEGVSPRPAKHWSERAWGEARRNTAPRLALGYRASRKPVFGSHLSASLTSAWARTGTTLRW